MKTNLSSQRPKSRVWFSHGKVIENGFFCPWCDCHRTGRIVKETYRWGVILKCGHVRRKIGYTLPPEELERKGFINYKGTEDPRYTARKKQEFLAFMAYRQHILDQRRIRNTLAGNRGVL